MTSDPTVAPYSAPAQPQLTGGRRIGVLLSHGFTGSPFSMRPWGESLAARGYGVEVPKLPGHGTSWQELNGTGWSDWYGELTRVFDRLHRDHDAVVVGGLSMGGALVLQLGADRNEQVSGVMVVNPAVATKRKDVLALPLLKHVVPAFPAIADDIKKPGVTEHAYAKTPLRAAHSMMKAWKPLIADLPRVTAPLHYFRSSVDHVVDELSQPIIIGGVSSRDITERTLANSYHVATLDNDAETIFDESAAFIARVTAMSPS